MPSTQTFNALQTAVGMGVAEEICNALGGAYGALTCTTLVSTAGITNTGQAIATGSLAATGAVSGDTVAGTTSGTFGGASGVVLTANGAQLPSFTTTNRDLISVTAASAGLVIFNSTTGKLNFYNGSGWAAVTSV